MTIAQQIAALPDAPFDVFDVWFMESGPVMVRGTCVEKGADRILVKWPDDRSERLKPSEVKLNRQDAKEGAAHAVMRWGGNWFFGPDGPLEKNRKREQFETVLELIEIGLASRKRMKREARCREEIDLLVYGIESKSDS